MSCLRLYTQKSKALISIIVTDVYTLIYPDIRSSPSVAMSSVFFMDCLNQFNHLFTIDISVGRSPILPFIVSGTAYTHHPAYIFDCIIAR